MAKKGVNPKPTGLPVDPASRYLPGMKMVPVPASPGAAVGGFGKVVDSARKLIGRPSPGLGVIPYPAQTIFNPGTVSNLLLDLDFSAAGVLFKDTGATQPASLANDPVADVTGTGGPAQQATALNQPTLQLAQQNGRNVVRFDGSNDYLALTTGLTLTAFTFFAVAKTPVSGSGRAILGGSAASGAPDWFYDTANNVQLNNDGVVALGGGSGAVPAGFHVVAVTYASPNGQHYVDGVTFGAGFSVATSFTNPVNQIGGIHSGALQQFNSDLGRVLVYGRVLTAPELAYVFAGLKSQWGIL